MAAKAPAWGSSVQRPVQRNESEMQVNTSRDGRIAVITISNPPVNALSVRAGLIDEIGRAVGRALRDADTRAIVLMADGRMFSAGADIDDFEIYPDTLERTRALTSEIIENASKPIIAALHGMALGGGLELALAAHYRICTPDAQLGLPEVTIGLLPGGGGTQRLPRLIGVASALDMMLTGKAISAHTALHLGLVDEISRGDLRAQAVELARSIGDSVRRTRDLQTKGATEADLTAAHARVAKSRLNRAPEFIVDCVDAAISKEFDDGMAIESTLFEQLRSSELSLGLRHAFMARRRVAQIPDLPKDAELLPIEEVAVVGAGTMGAGIALSVLAAGLPITLIDAKPEILKSAISRIKTTIEGDVAKGRCNAEAAEKRLANLKPELTIDSAARADLVIEAVFEDIAVKQAVFKELDSVCKTSAILATNTSTLDLNRIAGFTQRPGMVVGMHFFSPANVMRLLEVVRGDQTSPEVLATAMAFAKRIGKTGVTAGVCDGFIGNRIFEEYLRQAYFLLEEGALPAQVDRAMETWGMAMGPLRVMDLAGQDIGWSIRKRRAIEQPGRPYSKVPDLICEMGRFGQKTRAGYYLYPDGRTAQADPAIDSLVIDHSKALGIERRDIDDEEIVERCVLAMVNEGARILDEGIAYRPFDIDVVYVDGYGFPAERGGPMFHADRRGVADVLSRIKTFQSRHQGWAWEPAPLLERLVSEGRTLASLNS